MAHTVFFIGQSYTGSLITSFFCWKVYNDKKKIGVPWFLPFRSPIQGSSCSHWILHMKNLMSVLYWGDFEKKLL